MSDYISREEAIKHFREIEAISDRKAMEGIATAMDGIAAGMSAATVLFLKRIPAADVRPVVRGHIITEEEAIEMGDYSKAETCSVCGHCDWDCTEGRYFNYCPNCGAKLEAKA